MNIYLELALVSHPNHVLEVPHSVPCVPGIGDFVNREDSGWFGYVKSRRWKIRKDGGGIDVRCWLQSEPP